MTNERTESAAAKLGQALFDMETSLKARNAARDRKKAHIQIAVRNGDEEIQAAERVLGVSNEKWQRARTKYLNRRFIEGSA